MPPTAGDIHLVIARSKVAPASHLLIRARFALGEKGSLVHRADDSTLNRARSAHESFAEELGRQLRSEPAPSIVPEWDK